MSQSNKGTSSSQDGAEEHGDLNFQIIPKVEDKYSPPPSDDLIQPYESKVTRTAFICHGHGQQQMLQQQMPHQQIPQQQTPQQQMTQQQTPQHQMPQQQIPQQQIPQQQMLQQQMPQQQIPQQQTPQQQMTQQQMPQQQTSQQQMPQQQMLQQVPQQQMPNLHQILQHIPYCIQATPQQEEHLPPTVLLQIPSSSQKQLLQNISSSSPVPWPLYSANGSLALQSYYPYPGVQSPVGHSSQALVPSCSLNPNACQILPIWDNRGLAHRDIYEHNAYKDIVLKPQILLTPVRRSDNDELFITPNAQIQFSISDNTQKTDTNAQKAVAGADNTQKTDTDAQKAVAGAQKAVTDAQKAVTDAQKTDTDAQKAVAGAQKAVTDAQKTDTDAQKTDADAQKADSGVQKTDAGVQTDDVNQTAAVSDHALDVSDLNKSCSSKRIMSPEVVLTRHQTVTLSTAKKRGRKSKGETNISKESESEDISPKRSVGTNDLEISPRSTSSNELEPTEYGSGRRSMRISNCEYRGRKRNWQQGRYTY